MTLFAGFVVVFATDRQSTTRARDDIEKQESLSANGTLLYLLGLVLVSDNRGIAGDTNIFFVTDHFARDDILVAEGDAGGGTGRILPV